MLSSVISAMSIGSFRSASRDSKAALGRARMFVISHMLGPASATSINVFLHLADPDGGWRVQVIDVGVLSFLTLPFLMKVTGSLEWAARLSCEMLVALTLYGSYFYGGMSSPFLPWLLIALANGVLLSSQPSAPGARRVRRQCRRVPRRRGSWAADCRRECRSSN